MSHTKTVTEGELLDAVYKNVKMAGDSIINLMPKVKDEKLKSDLTVQLSTFEAFASRAVKLLGREGEKPEQETWMARMGAKWSSMVNTMMDSSTEHLAEMMVDGATMGVNDMMEQLRGAKHADISREALNLAQSVKEYEERVIEEMKAYLV